MKNILILIISILTFTISQSQNEWNFGLNIGSTYSGIRGNDLAEENKYAIDFLAGIALEYSFNENTSLKTNINYERKSYSRNIDVSQLILEGFDPLIGSNGSIKVRSSLTYLSIPILIKYNFGNQKKFFINGGPFIGFFLNSSTKVDGNKLDDNSNDLINSTDYGLSLGIGTKIKLNEKNNLNIEIRNNLGLSNISTVKTINDGSLKTNALNLIINWGFSL